MMRPFASAAALVIAGIAGLPAAAQGSGIPSRYIVFTLDASGVPRPQFHALVNLAAERPSRSEEEMSAWLHTTSTDHERVGVRLQDASGRVVFREVVSLPRWQRTEHGLHGEAEPKPFFGDSLVPLGEKAFVVRVPWLVGSRLELVGAAALEPGSASAAPAASILDLDALAEDLSLPLARFRPETKLLTSPAPNSGNRVDLLIMGDGYTAAQAGKFTADTTSILATFFGISPYDSYQNYFNVTPLFTASNQSGADHPPYVASCQATYPPTCCADSLMNSDPLRGTFADTAFDASYCTSNIHRLLAVSYSKVLAAAAASPDWDQILVVVNDTTYGGAGGGVSVVSTNPSAVDVARHEFGHTFTSLADEYSYGGGPLCSEGGGPDPCEANVTTQTSRALLKWSPFVLSTTPIPTPDTAAFGSVVGLFEGARYRPNGVFRPQRSCLMNSLGVPFCAVCRQEFVLRLYRGGWGVPAAGIDVIEPGSESPTPGVVSLTFPASRTFSVGVLQPVGGPPVTLAWSVNGAAVPGATGASYTFTPPAPGRYQLTLTARDATTLVHPAMAGSSLVRTRSWTVNVSPLGDLSITKRDDGSARQGQSLVYTLVARNAGPDPVVGAIVADPLPPQVTSSTWTCSASAGSSCPGSGAGNLNALVDLASGGSATFAITGTVAAGTARQIVNTASVTAPGSFGEVDFANNSASLTTAVARTMRFHTVPPCRLVDTRSADAPALAGATSRTFAVAGRCQIPPSAWAVSVNLTVTQPTGPGNLRAFPAGIPMPFTSSLNYAAGQTRGNNMTLSLNEAGQASVFCGQASGTSHFIMDVNGYFE